MPKLVKASERCSRWMKAHGWSLVASVELWIPMPGHPAGGFRRDLWGCFDLIALSPSGMWTMVQACSMSTRAEHLDKLASLDCQRSIRTWCETDGHAAELWSWRKLKVKRGGKAVRWRHERTNLITGEPIPAAPCEIGASDRDEAGLF